MSANLLDGVKPRLVLGSMADGVITSSTPKDNWNDVAAWPITSEAFAENQTMHFGLSAKWHGAAATTGAAWASVMYADAAGNIYNANTPITGITTEWQRFSLSLVVPSGMHLIDCHLSGQQLDAAYDATSFVLSYGSPVPLASSAHTPYATQDHVAAEYATKAALKVTSDAVTAEVTERGRLAGRVGTLESTSGTHASKLEQLAASIKSLVKGESTYTDPDGKSATSGIYSLVTQTRDSVTALFGKYTKTADMQSQIATAKSQATAAANSATDSKLSSYTKTADLASTQAVKDAKKAGTDAQETANATATMIRQYAGGVLVAKTDAAVGALVNANGSFDVVTLTWTNGVPSVSGTLSSFDADSADIGTAATPGAAVNLLGGAARFYVKQWDAASPESREVRLNSSGATIILGVDDEATNGGLWIDPYRSDGTGGKAGCEWPFNAVDLRADKLSFTKAPTWTVGRSVEGKCRSVFTLQGGTVFLSVNTDGDWWGIEGWVNVGPSLFSDYTHDQTTGVPPSLRPSQRVYFPASTYSGDLLKGYVETDGSIWLYRNGNLGSVANWSFSTSWPVGGAS